MADKYLDDSGLSYFWGKLKAYFQEKLISGTNIKTINSQSLLGSGNISVSGGGASVLDYYPVGSYYETSDSTFDPNVSWGGTWVLETEGLVHISGSASGTYQISGAPTDTQDGGSPYIQQHTHGFTNPTISNSSGGHTHTVTVRYRTSVLASGSAQSQPYANAGNTSNNIAYTPSGGGTHGHSYSANGSVGNINTSGLSTGSSGNMQPYIIVNRWHRTA